MNKNIKKIETKQLAQKRMPNASSAIKQKTIAVFYKEGMESAEKFSGYKAQTIYTWVQDLEKGELKTSNPGRRPYTKDRILEEMEDPNFLDHVPAEDKDFVMKLMLEMLL